MKKILLATVIFTMAYFTSNAQTKGTNTLGAGFNSTTTKYESNTTVNEYKTSSFSLGYGRFIKDNIRLGITGSYNNSDNTSSSNTSSVESDGYGGLLSLQKYFPLFNKFYAFAGGNTSYMYSKWGIDSPTGSSHKTDSYFLGAYGGVSYFLSKHFALEADLLSGGLNYSKERNSDQFGSNRYTRLDLSTSGTLTNLGFRVYFLF